MTDETVEQAVVDAVEQAYERWSAQHPSLAAMIDQIALTERAVDSLRNSPQYRQAVAAYHKGMAEAGLLNKLIDLAGPIITAILAG